MTSAAGRYELFGIDVGSPRCVWMTFEIRMNGYGSLTTIDNPISAGAYQGDFQLRPGDRRHYIGLPRASVNAYPDPSTYCSAGDWIAPILSETSNF